MQVNTIAFLFFLAISANCFSQQKLQTDIVDITKVSFFNPGFSYEKRIGKCQSIIGLALVSPSFSFGYSSSLGISSSISFDPPYLFNTDIIIITNVDNKKAKVQQ